MRMKQKNSEQMSAHAGVLSPNQSWQSISLTIRVSCTHKGRHKYRVIKNCLLHIFLVIHGWPPVNYPTGTPLVATRGLSRCLCPTDHQQFFQMRRRSRKKLASKSLQMAIVLTKFWKLRLSSDGPATDFIIHHLIVFSYLNITTSQLKANFRH